MRDAIVLWVALGIALCGLTLLWFAKGETADGIALSGTVVRVERSGPVARLELPIRGRGLHVGALINGTGFWDGEHFVLTSCNSCRP